MKKNIVQILLLCVLVSVATLFAKPVLSRLKMALFFNSVQETTVTLLRSEKIKFLVTHRLMTIAKSNISTEGLPKWILGTNKQTIMGLVRVNYGIDLKKISNEDVFKDGNGIRVKLPDAEVLEVKIKHDTVNTYKQRSGFNWIIDGIAGGLTESRSDEKLLKALDQLEQDAIKLLKENEALPTRGEILLAMNEWSELLSKQLGVPIRFE